MAAGVEGRIKSKYMDLKEFVRDALIDVVEGIRAAQLQRPGDAIINPSLKTMRGINDSGLIKSELDFNNLKNANLIATDHYNGFADIIEFDLAITVESSSLEEKEGSKKGEGGLKIHVVAAEIGIASKQTNKTEDSRSNVSRIKFRVPVQLPTS